MAAFISKLRIPVLISCLLIGSPVFAQEVTEYQVKALFIYNFAKFVEWPPESVANPRDPINICVLGQNPFGAALDQAVRGKAVGAREVLLKHLNAGDDAKSCQVLFVSTDKKRAKSLISEIANAPILTIGDSDGFTDSGGIIGFAMEDSKVRFDINLESAERSHLKISSKLLSLARSVKEHGK